MKNYYKEINEINIGVKVLHTLSLEQLAGKVSGNKLREGLKSILFKCNSLYDNIIVITTSQDRYFLTEGVGYPKGACL